MTASSAADAVLIAAAIVWILWKQTKPAPIKSRLLVAAPLVLAYFGIRDTPTATWTATADLGLIALAVVLSVVLGVARGSTIRVWRAPDRRWWRKGSRATLAWWGALAVVRIALIGVAHAGGHPEATGLGPVLLSLTGLPRRQMLSRAPGARPMPERQRPRRAARRAERATRREPYR